MRDIIQRTALLIATAGVIMWLIGGAKIGLFVTDEYISVVEPITEIEDGDWHPKFLPGIETLMIGCVLAGSFFLGSFLISNKVNSNP